FQQNSNWPLTF
nr:immunoglobulin light chain junction region [Macaca mulatta]